MESSKLEAAAAVPLPESSRCTSVAPHSSSGDAVRSGNAPRRSLVNSRFLS